MGQPSISLGVLGAIRHTGLHMASTPIRLSCVVLVTCKNSAAVGQQGYAMRGRMQMRFEDFSFGSIKIDDITYEHDVVIDRGEIRKRKKKPSKKFREEFGHTPLSVEESIPWRCRRLVVRTGAYGRLPVMKDVKLEAERRKIELLI